MPAFNTLAGILIAAPPLTSDWGPEVYVPLVRETVPAGAILPGSPTTETATHRSWLMKMADEAGVTVTLGVEIAGVT